MNGCLAWTPEEDARLRVHYLDEGKSVSVVAVEVGRTLSAVKSRMNMLGIKRSEAAPFWHSTEDELIRKGVFDGLTNREMGSQLARSGGAVGHRRAALGLKVKFPKEWSIAEEDILRSLFRGSTVDEMAETLGRTRGSVIGRMCKLGLRRYSDEKREFWSDGEWDQLRAMVENGSGDEDIGLALNRTTASVKEMKGKLGLRKKAVNRVKNLSDNQVERAIQMYIDGERTKQIEHDTGVPESVIYYLLKKHQIPKRRLAMRINSWTDLEKQRLVQLLDAGWSVETIASDLKRGESGVVSAARKMGLRSKYRALKDHRNKQKRRTTDTLEGRINYALNIAARRAKAENWDFDLTPRQLIDLYRIQNGNCFYTGVPLSFVTNDPLITSIDRINSSKGYIHGNVVLATWRANFSKQDMTVDEWLAVCAAVANRAPLILSALSETALPIVLVA